jgi:hypothetical protein
MGRQDMKDQSEQYFLLSILRKVLNKTMKVVALKENIE